MSDVSLFIQSQLSNENILYHHLDISKVFDV